MSASEQRGRVVEMPLPREHWLYAEGRNVPPMLLRIGTDSPEHQWLCEAVRAAAKYAYRASSMNGTANVDPDALVQNMVCGLLGLHTPDGLSRDDWANPSPIPPRVALAEIEAPHPWRCFHCDAVFTREVDAAEHFGGTMGALTGCQIKGHENTLLKVIRDQEDELVRHRAEDTDLVRAIASMRCEHSEAVHRAEELGFGRAVREMQQLAAKQFGREISL